MGLNWGGSTYPWSSAHVIVTLIVGFFTLVAFVLWECYKKLKEPLVPMRLFLQRSWVASTILSGLGQSIYYAFAIVWPQMVGLLYVDNVTPIDAALLSCVSGSGWAAGILSGGLVANYIRHIKTQCFISVVLGGLFLGCKWSQMYTLYSTSKIANNRPVVATANQDTRSRACGLVATGCFCIGWTESLAVTSITLTTHDQRELGSAGGIAGSIRFMITSICTTVYNVVLSNRQATEIPKLVAPAVIAGGLPASSVPSFIAALSVGSSAFAKIPGITPSIITAGSYAYKEANSNAFRTVFLTTIAFSGTALITTLFLPGLDSLMSDKVATTLGKEKAKNEEASSELGEQ
jgi:Fungal trichothecene efflux pump (TRI12)